MADFRHMLDKAHSKAGGERSASHPTMADMEPHEHDNCDFREATVALESTPPQLEWSDTPSERLPNRVSPGIVVGDSSSTSTVKAQDACPSLVTGTTDFHTPCTTRTAETPDPEESDVNEGQSHTEQAVTQKDELGEEPKELPKKKKKKKSSGKNRKAKLPITGFEDFFCDPPTTPAQFEEEQDLYDQSIPFTQRIEKCIQRYRARRSLATTRAAAFDKYLVFGGVQSSVKAFGGGVGNKDIPEDANAADIAAMRATDVIGHGASNPKFFDPLQAHNWVVDFEGVVKGYLSCRAPRHFGFEKQESIAEYCGVIKNFLNYVLTHSVCPEYTMDILEARRTCDLAQKELWLLHQASRALPGDFNKATSMLCGGYYEDLYVETSWTDNVEVDAMSRADAECIFKTAVYDVGLPCQIRALTDCHGMPFVVRRTRRSLEICTIEDPSDEFQRKYGDILDPLEPARKCEPLGKIRVKEWVNPEALSEDLSSDDEDHPSTSNLDNSQLLSNVFWLEASVLKTLFVGMKFDATVYDLNIDVSYFDGVTCIYPSFFTYLPNEKMGEWKEPVKNTRLAPMAGDVDGGDVIEDDE